MRKMLFAAVAVLTVLGLLLTGCSSPSTPTATPTASPTSSPTPSSSPSERVITVAGNFGNVPWEFKDNGKETGFEYEMVNEVAKLMGVKLEWTDIPFSGIVPGLVAEKWDMGASSIWITAQRAAQLDYADPYYESGTILCTTKANPIAKLEDMKGKIFGAESGSSNDAWLKEILPTYGPFEIKGYDRIQDGMLDLQAGRINGMVGDSPTVLYYIKDKPELVASLTAPGVAFYQAVYFPKGSSLRDEFNKAQNTLKTNGTLAAIYKKWFGVDPDPKGPTVTVFTAPYAPPTRTIKVAGNFGNVPWVFKDNGKETGFEYEMVEACGKLMGVKWEWTDLPSSGILPGLLAGKWDMAASSYFVTIKRVAEFDFADPYYVSDTGMAVMKTGKVKTLEEMKDGTFGAESGSSNDAWLKDIMPKYGPFTIKGYDRLQDGMLDLQAGRIDGMVGDSPTVLYFIKDKPDLEMPVLANNPFMQATFFRQGDALRDEFTKAENLLKENGILAAIYKKWFGVDPDPNSPTVKIFETPYVPDK